VRNATNLPQYFHLTLRYAYGLDPIQIQPPVISLLELMRCADADQLRELTDSERLVASWRMGNRHVATFCL
jgi:hypothetical protein